MSKIEDLSPPEQNRLVWAIEPAQEADIEQLESVRYKVWRSTYPQIAPDYLTAEDVDNIFADPTDAIERGRQALSDPTRHISLAKVSEDVVGFSISRIENEELGEILSIYVLDDFQGEGIGSGLLKEAMGWLGADRRPIKLEVVETNHKAIQIYEKYGFQTTRKLPKETPNPPLKYIPHLEMIRQPASIE